LLVFVSVVVAVDTLFFTAMSDTARETLARFLAQRVPTS